MSKTIVNQAAASPVALLEGLRLIKASSDTGIDLSHEDASSILSAEAWTRLKEEKVALWRNAWEDVRKPEVVTEVRATLGVEWPPPTASSATHWSAAREFLDVWDSTDAGDLSSETLSALKRLREISVEISQLLHKTIAGPIVIDELLSLGILRSDKGILRVSEEWNGSSLDVPASWFFERLVEYFFRAWDEADRDYRLLAAAYRWWMDSVRPNPNGELEILRGRMDDVFVPFNTEHGDRLALRLTSASKIGPWTTAICQLGLAWVPASGSGFARPFPDLSQFLHSALPHILKPGKEVPFDEFIAALGKRYPILDYSAVDVLPFGLSFSLRALHDEGQIHLYNEGDSRVRTRLAGDPAHKIQVINRVRRPS